ncbi:helix-turn-helix domain-containing protein [Streptomyces orinoci]|uniref:Helix-turn-helix transcriptional regulator n=1 Tax=Streptomyces orinoci TaxID=67339 RepID=A0ABV3K7N0_STRON|nr:helix-turn-helix transcriptional regulator [Streptomyces orinoci]
MGGVGDGVASPLEHFGEEVRLERERLGMPREELGKEACCSYSLVAKIEAGVRVPSVEFAEACDRVFPYAHGRFSRLATWVLKRAYPHGFDEYVKWEQAAAIIRRFQTTLVPGLAQTEAYARAVMATGRARNQGELVAARISRQHILDREHPPQLWIVLEESVLRRSFGGRDVMRAQLEKLLNLANTAPHVVQVVLDREETFHGVLSPFGVLSFDEGADLAHVDGFLGGQLLADPPQVADARDTFALITAKALPPDESSRYIRAVMKECY